MNLGFDSRKSDIPEEYCQDRPTAYCLGNCSVVGARSQTEFIDGRDRTVANASESEVGIRMTKQNGYIFKKTVDLYNLVVIKGDGGADIPL